MLLRLLDALIMTSVFTSEYGAKQFQPHYQPIVDFMLTLILSLQRTDFLREAAAGVLTNLVEGHSAPLIELGLVDKVVTACYTLCADSKDEQLDPTSFSSQNIGTSLLDVLTMNVKPTKQIVLDKVLQF